MTSQKRAKIPMGLQEEVLFRTNHTCCVCHTKGKDVQFHHIDGNNSNNTNDNLAVVCLDCHSIITGRRGLGKSYAPGEVRRYMRAWEKHVQDSRRVHQPKILYKKELVSQIDIIICEILALRATNPRIKELLDLLYELHIWRGSPEIDAKIREGLGHLALISSFSSVGTVAPLVSEKLYELCWQFVGPKDVPMNKGDLITYWNALIH